MAGRRQRRTTVWQDAAGPAVDTLRPGPSFFGHRLTAGRVVESVEKAGLGGLSHVGTVVPAEKSLYQQGNWQR